MRAAVSFIDDSTQRYCLTENVDAILADPNAIFVEDVEELKFELALRHPVPEGFSNIEDDFYGSLYVWKGNLHVGWPDGSQRHPNRGYLRSSNVSDTKPEENSDEHPVKVTGEIFRVNDGFTTNVTDLAQLENVAREYDTHIRVQCGGKFGAEVPEIDVKDLMAQWNLPSNWRALKYHVFPVGNLVVEPHWDIVEVRYDPAAAKRLRSYRKRAAEKAKEAVPVAELDRMHRAVMKRVQSHKFMQPGFLITKTNSRRISGRKDAYRKLPRLCRACSVLYRERIYQKEPDFLEALKILSSYQDALKASATREIKRPKKPTEGANAAYNRRMKKYRELLEERKFAKFFLCWLRAQLAVCTLPEEKPKKTKPKKTKKRKPKKVRKG